MACTINDKWGHNYQLGICTVCGRSQKPIHKTPSLKLAKAIFNRKKMSSDSGSQLAQDICEDFGGNFMFYRKIIKLVGEQTVREWFSECKQADKKYNRVALFTSIWKKFWAGIIWN